MKRATSVLVLLRLAMLLGVTGMVGFAYAAELRGTVSKVETDGQVQVDLPTNATARPGDELRIEATVPGVGTVELKTRWRVKLIGEGFVIAVPIGQASGTPQVGYSAILTSASPALSPAPVVAAPPDTTTPSIQTPTGVPTAAQNLSKLQQQAAAGDTGAMVLLGNYHERRVPRSDGTPRNPEEALRWYEKAAEAGDPSGMLQLGLFYQQERNDGAKAAEWFRKAAAKGNASAMLLLSMYTDNRGSPASQAEAIKWLRNAAEAGEASAAMELGSRYLTGKGLRQDFIEAAHWLGRAADQDSAPAMVQLARIYSNGLGLAKDTKRGFEWSLKAAQQGSPSAMYQVGDFYLRGVGTAANPAEARHWFEQGANNGDPEAMYGLAHIYDNGIGVADNPRLAAEWIIKAITAGSLQAPETLLRTPRKWSGTFHKEMQKGLQQAGVYRGQIDGNLNAGTRRAIVSLAGRALKEPVQTQ